MSELTLNTLRELCLKSPSGARSADELRKRLQEEIEELQQTSCPLESAEEMADIAYYATQLSLVNRAIDPLETVHKVSLRVSTRLEAPPVFWLYLAVVKYHTRFVVNDYRKDRYSEYLALGEAIYGEGEIFVWDNDRQCWLTPAPAGAGPAEFVDGLICIGSVPPKDPLTPRVSFYIKK